jgi:uncharacterized protein (UPF0335 family)
MSAADNLKSLAERILRLMGERDAIGGDIKDVFQEVKSAGFNSAALRKVIAAMRMDPEKRQALEFDVDAYRLAVGLDRAKAEEMLADGAGIRETHRATGAPLATLQRRSASRAKTKSGTPETDRADYDGAPEGQAAKGASRLPPRPDPIPKSEAGASSSNGEVFESALPAARGDLGAADGQRGVAPPASDTQLPAGAHLPPASAADSDPATDAAPHRAGPAGNTHAGTSTADGKQRAALPEVADDLAIPAHLRRGTPENNRARGLA